MSPHVLLRMLLLLILATHLACDSNPASPEPGAPEPEQVQPTADLPDEPPPFRWETDPVGPLHLNQSEKEVFEALGAPATKGDEHEEGATGAFVEQWTYDEAGVELWMGSEAPGGEKSVRSITLTKPSHFATPRGIAVGSSRAEVEKAYSDVKGEDEYEEPDLFVAGSIYGGIVFGFEKDEVSQIFVGASAE